MTYEEFTALAKREISTTEYHEVVEPVYTYHPAIPNKETAAKMKNAKSTAQSTKCAVGLMKSEMKYGR